MKMRKVQGNDSFQRINYLYQISKCVASKNPALSSYYGNLIIGIAKKTVSKIHPDIKRQLCKKCKIILIPDITASMKIKKKSQTIEWLCLVCGAERRFPAHKGNDHRVWLEKPEAVVEVISKLNTV